MRILVTDDARGLGKQIAECLRTLENVEVTETSKVSKVNMSAYMYDGKPYVFEPAKKQRKKAQWKKEIRK